MLQSEFIKRTGYCPTYDEYKALEEMYNSFEGDKDEFCDMFTKKKATILVQAREIACRNMQSEREKWMHERGGLQTDIAHLKDICEYEKKRCESIENRYKELLESKDADFAEMKKQNAYFMSNLQKNIEELNKENEELRKQVEAFKQVINVIQN